MSLFGDILGNETELKNRITKLSEAVQSWKDGYTQLKQEHEKTLSELTPLKQKCATLQSDIGKHTAKAQAQEKEKATMAATISTLQERINTLETEAQEQTNQRKELEAKAEEQNQTLCESNTQLQKARLELEILSRKVSWVKLAEVGDEVGYRGYLSNCQILHPEIIRIKLIHLKQIPSHVESGDEYFEDGSHYPIDLMDYIRTGKTMTEALQPALQPETQPNNQDNDLSVNEQKTIDYITDHPRAFNKEISETLDINKGSVSRILKSLMDRQIIREDEDGGYTVNIQ